MSLINGCNGLIEKYNIDKSDKKLAFRLICI